MAQSQSGPPGPEPLRRRAAWWWLAGGTFVLGLFVGAIVVGLLADGTTVVSSPAAATSSSAGGSAGTSSPAASASAVVNDACLQAIQEAQDVYGIVGDAGQALSHFNASRLDELVKRLRSLQSRLRSDISDCRVSTGAGGGSGSGSAPSGTSPGA